MNPTIRDRYGHAAEMAPEDRAELAGLLLENLEGEEAPGAEIEAEWAAEVERRMVEFRAGRVKTLSWRELRSHLYRSDR